jgi:hypothetical protein
MLALTWTLLISYWVWGCWSYGITGTYYFWWHQYHWWVVGSAILGIAATLVTDLTLGD